MPGAPTLTPRRNRSEPWPGHRGIGGWARVGLAASGALVAALYLTTRMPSAGPTFGIALTLGAAVATWFAVSARYEVTLTLVAAYLCLLDGFVKLRTGNPQATFVRDILFYAVVFGAAGRLYVARRRLELPPLSPWVIGFAVVVLVQVFNPNTLNATKALAGVRQQLEFVPLFFFGYALLRTRERLRFVLLAIAVFAAINGVVGLIQTQLTPEQFASWGPGYRERVFGAGDVAARVFYDATGTQRTRPFGLGGDVGFAGAMGLLAVPMVLALLSVGTRTRRAWLPVVLGLWSAVGIITSQGRTIIIGAIVAVLAFLFLGLAGRRAVRSVAAVAVAAVIGVVVVPAMLSGTQQGAFDRYASISPDKVAETAYSYRIDDLSYVREYVTRFPLGAGLGTVGPARVFGGTVPRGRINGETQFNFLLLELGVAGLVLFVAFAVKLTALIVRRLPRVDDLEARAYLAGMFAPLITVFLIGFAGPTTTAPPFGPYVWLVAGVAAYWLFPRRDERQLAPAGLSAATPGESRERIHAPASLEPGQEEVSRVSPAHDFAVTVCLLGDDDPETVADHIGRVEALGEAVHQIVVVHGPEIDPMARARLSERHAGLEWLPRSGDGREEAWRCAAAHGSGSHVLLLDDEVEPHPGFLAAAGACWSGTDPEVRGRQIVAGSEQVGGRRLDATPATVVVTSTVFPRGVVELLDGAERAWDGLGLHLPAAVAREDYVVICCPDALNRRPAATAEPRAQPESVTLTEARRITASARRRGRRNALQGALYYAAAATNLYANELQRSGRRGLTRAWRALDEARARRDSPLGG
jgi:hypothetical protein